MARRKIDSGKVSGGVHDVLSNLGIENAAELTTKVKLAVAINRQLAERGLSQIDAAELLGINQPKISALRNFKVDGFSAERLMTFLTALGSDIDIVVRNRKRSAGSVAGKISVSGGSFAKLRGRATEQMRTDEVLALTRGAKR